MTDSGGRKQRTDEIAVETQIVILAMIYLPGFSDFLVFRLTCEGPASATVCAGSARGVRIRCPTRSKAKMQALTYIECIGCLGN